MLGWASGDGARGSMCVIHWHRTRLNGYGKQKARARDCGICMRWTWAGYMLGRCGGSSVTCETLD